MVKNIKLLFSNPKKFFRKFKSIIEHIYGIYILRDRHLIEAKRWFRDNGDETLRLEYELNESSIVFDVGGYKGDFTEKYLTNFNHIFIFLNLIQNFITA